MIFTTNKPLNEWGKVLHDEDMAAAILDRVLERGRFIHLDGPSGRTRHLNLEETLQENTKRLRISGIGGSELPEPTTGDEIKFTAVNYTAEPHKPLFWRRIAADTADPISSDCAHILRSQFARGVLLLDNPPVYG